MLPPAIVNHFDSYALEAAARIKDKNPDTRIIAVSMGLPKAADALRECISIAADKAYLISDRSFGGSDTLATSYIISEAVKKIEALEGKMDLIFCGKQAIDGDTAQVGPEIAEHLNLPQVTYALEAEIDGDNIKVRKETEDGIEIIGAKMPVLVTFTKPSWDPRFPTVKRRLAARKADIPTLTAADIPAVDLERAGLKGSPTKVKKTFVPQKKTGGIKIDEGNGQDSARKLFHVLADAGVI